MQYLSQKQNSVFFYRDPLNIPRRCRKIPEKIMLVSGYYTQLYERIKSSIYKNILTTERSETRERSKKQKGREATDIRGESARARQRDGGGRGAPHCLLQGARRVSVSRPVPDRTRPDRRRHETTDIFQYPAWAGGRDRWRGRSTRLCCCSLEANPRELFTTTRR